MFQTTNQTVVNGTYIYSNFEKPRSKCTLFLEWKHSKAVFEELFLVKLSDKTLKI